MKLVRAKKGYRKVGDKYLLAKKCTKCGKWLVANTVNFHKNKKSKYGLYSQCRECSNNKQRTRNNPVNTNPNITKVCTVCGREFPATVEYFHKSKIGQYGLEARCKECRNNKDNSVNTDPSITKVCTTCGRTFPATLKYFNKSKHGKYGLRGECKFCIAEKRFEADDNYPINTDPSITKVCTTCGREFPATVEYFNKRKGGQYGLNSKCKECISNRIRTINNPVNTDPSILRRCTKCGKRLPATEEYFYKQKSGKYGLKSTCKECSDRKNWEWRHREELAQRQALLEAHRKKMDEEKARKIEARKPLVAEKTCSKCGKTKPASEFHANARSKDHLSSYCKDCNNKAAKERYYHKLETMSFGE